MQNNSLHGNNSTTCQNQKGDKNSMKHSYTTVTTESTTLVIEKDILSHLTDVLSSFDHTAYFILCDKVTRKLFLETVKTSLLEIGKPVHVAVIDPGEKSKQFASLQKLLETMYEALLDRKSAVIALGGGVVGDIATTIAGLYFRGIDCIQIPTTLLAQVDSALGGKGAVDLDTHKNTIGIIKQPKAIIIDPNVTKTLPEEQIRSGMGEVIKYAIAMDKELFEKLEQADILNEDTMEWIIKRCVTLKMETITKDPLDTTGVRAIVNFGHTLGQAIELNTSLSHGEAVAVGMTFAVHLSKNVGLLKEEVAEKVLSLIKKYHLPTRVSGLKRKEILAQMKKDKKTINGQIRFVLLRHLGNAETNQEASDKLILATLKEVLL